MAAAVRDMAGALGSFGANGFFFILLNPGFIHLSHFGIDARPVPSGGYQACSPRPVAAFVGSGLVAG